MEGLCTKAAPILQFVGWVLTIFKIAIPLLIVALGMFDFGKAVTSGKDDDIKKSAKTLLTRALSGVIIFFVPTIVLWLFGRISGYDKAKEGADDINYNVCEDCMLRPWKSDCKQAVSNADID